MTGKSVSYVIDQQTLPIGRSSELSIMSLFRRRPTVSVMDFFINKSVQDKTYCKIEIQDNADVNGEPLRQAVGSKSHIGSLVKFGIIDIDSTDMSYPQYTLADTDIVSLIGEYRNMDSTPRLVQFFETSVTRQLTQFFLIQADPGKQYSIDELIHETPVNYQGIDNNIEQYIEYSIVEAKIGDTGTAQYKLNEHTYFQQFCLYLNNRLHETYKQRSDKYC